MRSLRAVLAAAALAVAVSIPATDAVAAGPEPLGLPKCTVTTDYPHLSSTPGKGIDAKTKFRCDVGVAQTYTNVKMYLFLCDEPPSGPEDTWWQFGCVQKASRNVGTVSVGSGKTETRQVPYGGAEAHGTGWWIQCTFYVDSTAHTKTSAAVPLSG